MSSVPRIDDSVFEIVREIKVLHAKYVSLVRGAPANLIELAKRIWGAVVTYRYEDNPVVNVDLASRRLYLAALIAERFALRVKRGLWKHVTVAIVGLGGSGKTTYAVLSAYGALRLCGFNPLEAVKMVGAFTFFTPNDFVKVARRLIENREWVPFMIIDDVGAQISKYWIFLGQHFWAYLFSILDQLKDWCGVLIMTARSFNSIPARLREITDIVVEAKEVDVEGMILDVFKFVPYDDYTSKRRRERNALAVDVLLPTVRMPQDLWNKMVEARRTTGLRRIQIVDKMLELLPKVEEMRLEKFVEKVEKRMEESEEEEEIELPEEMHGEIPTAVDSEPSNTEGE